MDIFKKIKRMRLSDWHALILLTITFLPGKLFKLINSNIWVISEYEMMARDNGYWFYKFMREKHGEITCYYPINRNSPDYNKVNALGNVINYGSLKHYCLFWAAKVYCGSGSVQGFPYPRICEDIVLNNLHGFKYVFLNHGITRGYSHIVNNKTTNYDILCTCSDIDKNIIISENGQTEDIVKVTGYARHDNLDDLELDDKLIVIMPTWREWLSYRNAENDNEKERIKQVFLHSNYYKRYMELLNDERLDKYLRENDMKAIFYLHQYAQPYSHFFTASSERVEIGTFDKYDVQSLLKSAVLLITDYSSVCYDYAYMYKPVLYYQFDIDEFEMKQYSSGGSFSYEEDGLGRICYDKNEVITELEHALLEHFIMPEVYRERVNKYFNYHDRDNCKRIYEQIILKE